MYSSYKWKFEKFTQAVYQAETWLTLTSFYFTICTTVSTCTIYMSLHEPNDRLEGRNGSCGCGRDETLFGNWIFWSLLPTSPFPINALNELTFTAPYIQAEKRISLDTFFGCIFVSGKAIGNEGPNSFNMSISYGAWENLHLINFGKIFQGYKNGGHIPEVYSLLSQYWRWCAR